jgi:hypothetical protein
MRAVIAFLTFIAISSAAGFAAAPVIGSYDYGPIGAPRATGKVVIDVTIYVNGAPVTKTVTIPSGAIKPYPAVGICMPADPDKVCAQKIADARGAASQAKAMVIANAINTAFAAEFKQLGQMVTVGNTVVTGSVKARGTNFMSLMATYGALLIPGVPENQVPLKLTENGVMGEGGNGGRFIPPPGQSPNQKGSLDRTTPGVEMVATGENAHGYPSEVDFGVVGTYVAEVDPTAGMTDAQVLQQLADLLNTNGVPATYDPSMVDLSLNVPADATINWGNTDAGLDFTFSQEGLAPALPEPEAWTVLTMAYGGAGLISILRRRRKRR